MQRRRRHSESSRRVGYSNPSNRRLFCGWTARGPSRRRHLRDQSPAYRTAHQPVRSTRAAGARSRTIRALGARFASTPGVDGIEQGRQRHCRPAERRGRSPPYDRRSRTSSGAVHTKRRIRVRWSAQTSRSTAPASSSSTNRSSAHLHRRAWVALVVRPRVSWPGPRPPTASSRPPRLIPRGRLNRGEAD
jgi:hypothetical protein